MATVADALRPPIEHICSQCGKVLYKSSHYCIMFAHSMGVFGGVLDAHQLSIVRLITSTIQENANFTLVVRDLQKDRLVVALRVVFHQATDPTFLSEPPPVFKTTPIEILTATDIDEVLQSIYGQLLTKIDDFEMSGSGWLLHELSRLDLHTFVYNPLLASTYIPLPEDLKAKQAVVNIQNKV